MALRSAVAVGSEVPTGLAVPTVPTGLWAWIDSDSYAYWGFENALICHRPAWLYQRLYDKASLHRLVREVTKEANEKMNKITSKH